MNCAVARLCLTLVLSLATLTAAGATDARAQDNISSPTHPVTTRELVEIRGLSGLAVSPEGAYAVVRIDQQDIHGNRTKLSWTLVRLRDGHITPLADAGVPRWNDNGFLAPETPQWSPDGAWIYFLKLSGEEVQLWRARRDGGSAEQVTHDASDVVGFIVAPNGTIHYAVGPATRDAIKAAEDTEAENGVLQERSLIFGFPIEHNFPVNGRMATVRRLPSVLGRSTLLGDEPLRVSTLDPHAGRATSAEPALVQRFENLKGLTHHGLDAFDPHSEERARSHTSHRLASLIGPREAPQDAPASQGRAYLSWRAEADTSPVICREALCTDPDHIDIVGWTEDGKGLVFQTRTFETLRFNLWNIEADTVRTIIETDNVFGSYESGAAGACQLAQEEAICITAAADKPPRLVAVDLVTGRQRTLLEPNPSLSADRLGEAQKITLTDRFGSTTIGEVILPRPRDTRQRLPLVITSYGCRGFLLGGSGRDVPEHVLAGLGYAAVCIDLGGDVVRRAAAFTATPHNYELSALDFFEDAVRSLDRRRIIDSDRVVLTGFSGSSTDTAFAISQSTAFTAAVVTTQGSTDAIICYVTAAYRSCADQARKEGYKKPYDSRDGFLKYSPAWNVEKITAPLLMQLADVEYVPMMQLYGAMLDYGRAVEMDIFPGAYHYKNKPRQRLAVYNRNVDWINYWLRGLVSSEPRNANQNRRWSAMRESQCKLFTGDGALPRPPWYCRS